MDGQGNTLMMRDLPTSVPHCISPAVTYTSGAGVYGPVNLGQTSGLCHFAASMDTPRSRPGLWLVGCGGKLTSSSQPTAPLQQAGLLSARLLGHQDETGAGLLGASTETGTPMCR